MLIIIIGMLLILVAFVAGALCFYHGRLRSICSLKKITANKDYNVYSMNIQYNYDLYGVIASKITDDKSFMDIVVKKAAPGITLKMEVPNFACSAFILQKGNRILTGRNYDFHRDTSCLMIRCQPRNCYKSIALCALDNLQANQAERTLRNKMACLAAPYVCLDGINEKGVAISVLTLDSVPTRQNTGKPLITTGLAIRLVLDKAASTQEAVELLNQYDMLAVAGRDYHFYITDASGDGRVVEYDVESPDRALIDTPMPAITNFFGRYESKVLPFQHNGIYGHGKERYDIIRKVQTESEDTLDMIGWKALQGSAQLPKEKDITSNTQWSALYDNKALTLEVAFRRNWNEKLFFSLNAQKQ